MATLDLTKVWNADEVLTHTDLNGNFSEIETFLNAATLDTDNISTKYATVAYVLSLSGVAQGETYNYKIKLPSGSSPVGALTPKTFSLQAERTAGTLTAYVLEGTDVLVTLATTVTTVDSTESVSGCNIAPAAELTIRVVADGSYAITANTIPTVAFHALTEIRSS